MAEHQHHYVPRDPRQPYAHRVLVAIDVLWNVILGGAPDETISSRAQRASDRGKLWGVALTRFLHLFQRQHGRLAERADIARARHDAAIDDRDLHHHHKREN